MIENEPAYRSAFSIKAQNMIENGEALGGEGLGVVLRVSFSIMVRENGQATGGEGFSIRSRP